MKKVIIPISCVIISCSSPSADSEIQRIRDSIATADKNNALENLKDSISFEQHKIELIEAQGRENARMDSMAAVEKYLQDSIMAAENRSLN